MHEKGGAATMHLRLKCLGLVLLLSLPGGRAEAREETPIFDKPISEKVISLQADAVNPPEAGTLSCFYYNGFMVKEIDTKQKGADRLSIVRTASGQPPPCTRDNPGEITVKDWYGYFAGAKGRYVLFSSDDGSDGAMGYAAFDGETGAKLFVLSVEVGNAGPPYTRNIHSLRLSGDNLTVLYRRVHSAGCSLYDGKSDCWKLLRKELELADDASAPDCRKSYEEAQQRAPTHAAQTLTVPTIIGYEAKLTYSGGQITISKEPGPMRCWIAD